MNIIAATQNEHKIKEIETITKEFGLKIISRNDAGVPDFEIEETGDTFEENSLIKAKAICDYTKMPAIADDSGLEVNALNGAPGVISARFAGENATDEENNKKLLALMKGKEDKSAKFVSVITLIFPDGKTVVARGECDGQLIDVGKGSNGFGYDPLFIPNGYDLTFAELSSEEKNKMSHRANALNELKKILETQKNI